jgi:hypothetical protein
MATASNIKKNQAPLPLPAFDRFYKHQELTELLQAFAAARPELVELRELGTSHENRPFGCLFSRESQPVQTQTSPHFGWMATFTQQNLLPARLVCTGCTIF